MLSKLGAIFLRDLKVNLRDFIALYILVIPVLLAFGINALAPSVNDTTVNIALLAGDNPAMVTNLEQYAKVTLYPDMASLTDRVAQRDDVVAMVPEGEGYYILAQGNESASVVDAAKLLMSYVDLDFSVADTTAQIETFGRTEPPMKKMLVNLTILLTSVLAGMLISINIVEEKIDNTISAMNVSPVSRLTFVLGKSGIGIFLAVYGSLAVILITGYGNVNLGQLLLTMLSVTVLSILIGFIEGVNNDDVINAAAGIKMLFVPLGAAVAAAELLSDKWQPLFYWIPFYWTYKGNDAILSYSATWAQIGLYTAIVLVISGAAYLYLAPKIQKGLA